MCEYLYHTEGIKVEGECEMRQKWYPSGLEPRTYYAMGGRAYHLSKYIAGMFETICDLFPYTHRHMCTKPSRLHLMKGDHLLLYDLTSFTSNLHEHRGFIESFGMFCLGVPVYVLDGREGYISVDLGELILEYATLYAEIPIDTHRVYPRSPMVIDSVASLLGIYGNISSAKLLHGLIVRSILGNDGEVNVAGDDGACGTSDDRRVLEVIRLIGMVQDSKCYSTTEIGCVHLKRPIYQDGQTIRVGWTPVWPSFEYPDHTADVDPRYPHIASMTIEERRSATCSTITTFLMSLEGRYLECYEQESIHAFLMAIYDSRRFPKQGNIPQISGHGCFVPSIEAGYIGKNPKTHTIDRLWNGFARLPRRDHVEFHMDMLRDYTFECSSHPLLTYYRKMGYMTSQKIHQVVFGEEGYKLLTKEYMEGRGCVYTWTRTIAILPFVRYN